MQLNARVQQNVDLSSAVADAAARYAARNPRSKAQAEAAASHLPGGNTRTILHFDPFPLGLAGGNGCTVTDLDGHSYADYLGEYTAGLYGHSHPKLQAAIRSAVESGVTLGGPNLYEAELARLMCARFPSLDLVRFCNSGTEANLFAISAARAHTGRAKVMVFNGAYHGGVFYFGQHAVPINAPFPWVMARYNDIEGTLSLVESHGNDLAAIVIEPMLGGGGAVAATTEFLEALRAVATKHGIVLIFDEVMTSRLSPGGLQQLRGVTPDMTTFGKYLGGGMTFGAFGGRADIMRRFNPYAGDAIPHAGTFNNNIVSMAAGAVGLRDLYTPAAADALNASGESLKTRLNALGEKRKVPFQVMGVGSILCVHFHEGPIKRPEDWWPEDAAAERRHGELQKLFHLDLLELGQYMARRGFISLSLPMTECDHDRFVDAVDEVLSVRAGVIA